LEVSSGEPNGPLTSAAFDAGWYAEASADTPDMLELALDKPEYHVGDTMMVAVTARTAGKVTLNIIGDRLINTVAADVEPGVNRLKVSIGRDWGNGGYVLATLRRPHEVRLREGKLRALPEPIRADTTAALETPAVKRNEVQKYLAAKFEATLRVTPEEVAAALSLSDRAEAEKLYRKAAELFTEMGAQGEERRVEAAMARHGWLVETAETSTVEAAQLRALLDVALATTSSLDAASQSRAALDELVRVFGAERAFLFLLNGDSNALVMTAGRDAQGQDLTAQTDYSNTVVEKVRATRAPVVVTGTAQGALLGSESALVYNLRSIFAAPLMVKDKLVGVVYLDNRLEKGLRTKTDLQVLQAIASHIAIAIESARAARVELDRRALENEKALLEKDLELTSAVQAMFLPRTAEIDRVILAFHRGILRLGEDVGGVSASGSSLERIPRG